MRPSLIDALTGCLLGQALGDALGFVVEAEPPEIAGAYVEGCLRAGHAGSRSHPDFPFGQYSDDTQLARELLCSVRAQRMGPGRLRSADRRSVPRAGVRSVPVRGLAPPRSDCSRASCGRKRAGRHHTPATGAPCERRPSASSFATIRDDAARGGRAELYHPRDPRCAAGSLVVAGGAALTSSGGSLRPEEFLERLAEWAEPEDQSLADAVRGVAAWLDLTPVEAARALHRSGLDSSAGDRWRGVSSFVVPSVAWSLYAFLRSPDDYWTVVSTAIGAGGDTDTMAAIAGAMAGARGGVGALPGPLLGFLNDQGTWRAPELTSLACDCARIAAISRHPPPS